LPASELSQSVAIYARFVELWLSCGFRVVRVPGSALLQVIGCCGVVIQRGPNLIIGFVAERKKYVEGGVVTAGTFYE
jgi:hypothetical protein